MEGMLSMNSGAESYARDIDTECRFATAKSLGEVSAQSTDLHGLPVFMNGSPFPKREGGP
jgi:hypothetical protein